MMNSNKCGNTSMRSQSTDRDRKLERLAEMERGPTGSNDDTTRVLLPLAVGREVTSLSDLERVNSLNLLLETDSFRKEWEILTKGFGRG